MALLGEQRYSKRSGDSFYQMEHFDLEDMFGRRQRPALQMFLERVKFESGIEDYAIFVKTDGRAVARYAGFLIKLQNVEIKAVGPQLRNLSEINAGDPVVAWDKQPGVIHPNGIRLRAGVVSVARIDDKQSIAANVNTLLRRRSDCDHHDSDRTARLKAQHHPFANRSPPIIVVASISWQCDASTRNAPGPLAGLHRVENA